MNHRWPLTPIREVLVPVSRPERVDPEKSYNILGAHWYAEGLYTKDVASGSEIRASNLYRVQHGDFVYNRLFGWKGSFAVASDENHDCYVSNEFPCFTVRSDRADGKYLWKYFSLSSVWDEVLSLSTGGTPTSRNRLKEAQLLAMKIPLPPLPEQRRIVARIEELSAKIEEARRHQQAAIADSQQLLIGMAHREDMDESEKREAGWIEVRLGEVIRQVDDRHLVTPNSVYPNLGIYSFGRGVFKKPPIDGALTSASVLNRIRSGQFIYSRLFAFEGAYGMVPEEFDGWYVSNEFPSFECDTNRVRAEFLYAYFKSPSVWIEMSTGSKGLGHRRQRVQPDRILAHRVMLPPIGWQNQIRSVMTKLHAIEDLRAQTAEELNALMPSILSKAFAGEL